MVSTYGDYSSETFTGKGNNRLWYTEAYHVKPFFKEATEVEIKYVVKGPVNYVVQGQNHTIGNQKYLIINRGRSYEGFVEPQPVATHGLYFFLDIAFLAEVDQSLFGTDACLLEKPDATGAMDFDFLENISSAASSKLGLYLQQLAHQIIDQKAILAGDMFYSIAKTLLESQKATRLSIANIRAEKPGTRQELYRRLILAREFMEDHGTRELRIADIAREAALSEYHFLRTFKQAFGVSPYQFLLEKKLAKAKDLLNQAKLTISEIASETGFSELSLFSRAFKNRYGLSPTQFKSDCRKSG